MSLDQTKDATGNLVTSYYKNSNVKAAVMQGMVAYSPTTKAAVARQTAARNARGLMSTGKTKSQQKKELSKYITSANPNKYDQRGVPVNFAARYAANVTRMLKGLRQSGNIPTSEQSQKMPLNFTLIK